jgi:hypothetical protein
MSRRFGETPNALRAFEDYWQMGPKRSAPALAAEYRQRSDRGIPVPTRRERTLAEWSVRFGWQARIKERIAKDAAEANALLEERHTANRLAAYNIVEVELRRLHHKIRRVGEEAYLKDEEADPLLANTASGFSSLVNVMQSLAGQPQKHDVRHSADPENPPPATYGYILLTEEECGLRVCVDDAGAGVEEADPAPATPEAGPGDA